MPDLSSLIVFAHVGAGLLPDHESLMFLMPTLPLMFIGTVIAAKALDRRGLLGDAAGTVSLTTALAAIAAGLSIGSAAIHFAVIKEHLEYDLGYGLFFVGLAWFQAIWALLYMINRGRALAVIAVLVNVFVVGVWIVSRTVGLPFGPTPWVPEAVGTLDLFATGFEIVLVGILLPTVAPRRFGEFANRRLRFEQAFVLGAFCVITIALLATVALLGTTAVDAS